MDQTRVIPADIAPAPWKFRHGGVPGWKVTSADGKLVCFSKDNQYQAPNAEFICWARNHIDQILAENDLFRAQHGRLITQTAQMRQIYELVLDIKNWLVVSEQPDTYIDRFLKLTDDSGIFRESAL